MKKIGIFTFHRSINYGAFMQSYSLSKKIQKELPDTKVEIIDYTSAHMEEIYKPAIKKWTFSHPIYAYLKYKQYYKFRDSLSRLPLSSKCICSDGDTDNVLSAYEKDYDAFVVGSDAVWNWIQRGFPNPYIMNFKSYVVKLSYAASAYGMSKDYVTDSAKEYFRQSLEKFSFIGVRDEYTESLVKDVCPNVNPVYTCDPTVFLDLNDVYNEMGMTKEEFKTHIYKKYKIPTNKKLIGVMGAPANIIKRIKSEYGSEYCVIGLYNFSKCADVQMVDLTPFEWAAVFSLFELTLTTFFHGTLLSLRNATPVVNFDSSKFSKENEGKIHDVMRRMNLLDCHFKSTTDESNIMAKVSEVLSKREIYSDLIQTNIKELEKSHEEFLNKLREIL